MRILLAVDGSKVSCAAAEALNHFAPPEHVGILHVVEIASSEYEAIRFKQKDLSDIVGEKIRPEAERIVKNVASHLSPKIGKVSQFIETGNPAEHILDLASHSKADLIVVGARGLNRLSELLFGSVSHRVMTHASCSTLIVKSAIAQLQHVLLPIEGAEDTKRAITFLKKMPFRECPFITVMHTVPFEEHYWLEGSLPAPSIREELVGLGKVLTDSAVSQLKDIGYQAESLVRYGLPADLIQATVSEKHPDLVIVGSHGGTGISRFLMGSVSHSVVHRTPGSVLVVR